MSNQHQSIRQQLENLLANTYCLYLKTQNFHWNIVGPSFYMLHLFLEKQYEELAEASDLIAERLRALNFPSPGSFKAFSELMTLEDAKQGLTAEQMLQTLTEDHLKISNSLRDFLSTEFIKQDEGTQDLFIERLREHEKSIWMFSAHLKNK